jgi:single-strand DNA-binding protein
MASASLNKVQLIGNLGKDPELKVFEGGNSLARFPIATSETYTNRSGEEVTQTEWHTIVLRRGLAEVADKYLKKGDRVYIEGKIRTRSWQDQSGDTRYTTEVQADQMIMLGGNRDAGNNTATAAQAQSANPASKPVSSPSLENEEEDDLPF